MVVGLSWQRVGPGASCCGVRASLCHWCPTPGYPEPGASCSCVYGFRSIQHREHCAVGYLQTGHLCAGSILHLGTQHWEHCAMGHMQSGHPHIISIPGLGARCWGHPAMGALSSGLSDSRASLCQQHPASGNPSPPALGSSCNGVPKVGVCLHCEHPAPGYQPWVRCTQGSLCTQLCCAEPQHPCTFQPMPYWEQAGGLWCRGAVGRESIYSIQRVLCRDAVFYKLLAVRAGLRGCWHTQGYASCGSPRCRFC